MIFNKNVNYKYGDFKVENGKLFYKGDEVKDIEKFLDEIDNKTIKSFEYFIKYYKDEVKAYYRTKQKIKLMLNEKLNKEIENLTLDWDEVKDLRNKQANEIRKKTIEVLKQLDEKLEKMDKWEYIEIATVEYEEYNRSGNGDERVVLVWDKERGYYFEGQEYRYDEWETREKLDLIDFNKYKNLTIDNITNKMALKIAKKLPQKIEMLNNMLIKDLEEKEKILYELNCLKEVKNET